MADSESYENNGNGTKVVPIAVLDRFLRISKENNDAYSAMVCAVDAISAKVMEMGDQVGGLAGTIEEEQLAEVINTAVASITADVEKLQGMMGSLSEPKYNILKGVAEYLEYKKADEKEVQNVAKSIVWLMSIMTLIRQNSGKLLFLAGVTLAFLLGSSGLTAWDALKALLK